MLMLKESPGGLKAAAPLLLAAILSSGCSDIKKAVHAATAPEKTWIDKTMESGRFSRVDCSELNTAEARIKPAPWDTPGSRKERSFPTCLKSVPAYDTRREQVCVDYLGVTDSGPIGGGFHYVSTTTGVKTSYNNGTSTGSEVFFDNEGGLEGALRKLPCSEVR